MGLVCFAAMTFYISDLSIQHTTETSNYHLFDAMPQTTHQLHHITKTIKLDANGNEDDPNDHSLAGLSCDAYGGPSHDLAQEMVYWQDIPSDRYETNRTFFWERTL